MTSRGLPNAINMYGLLLDDIARHLRRHTYKTVYMTPGLHCV